MGLNIALFHPYLAGRGGSQRYIIETAKVFKKHGHNVQIYTFIFNDKECYPEFTKKLDIISLRQISTQSEIIINKPRMKWFFTFLKYTGLISLVRYCANMINVRKLHSRYRQFQKEGNFKYDILYVHETGIHNRFAKKSPATRNYLYCYDTPDKFASWDSHYLKVQLFYRFGLHLLKIFTSNDYINYFEEVFILDETMKKKAVQTYHVNPLKIYGCIDTKLFKVKKNDFLRKKYKLKTNTIMLSCVSRFVPYKRIHDAIDAVIKLNERILYFYINAFKEDIVYFEQLMEQYKENIFPKGNIIIDTQPSKNDKALASIYQSSDLYIFPNENQTWGNSVLEGMACGCCCLVSDECGIKEIISKGKNGFIFGCGRVNQIAGILKKLKSDRKLRKQVSSNAAGYIGKNFSWENWYENHMKIFEAGGKNKTPRVKQ